ncbi:hypothetical protein DDB_G0269978 [Dictyostelium discoideum AX4]|uniref:CTL-like protein DDB_G0269978 n=1 Tax=Dictyostelium discoideum TaxID=44689 RepID=CTLHC_DICDI|nr:hypothetical protein DDB_G0269978 [Dictyostelium discoideum AX4]Q55CN8.1 RecName: Full=CTL-like protein DDB_G0269978 [Dictyostelium discoideum]EAL72339.1 hypothetical protein DDB_G0269978 [Dictyostelium discoideum AX4]|eukprot:XP_646443.1 hypothetical protein DDB_G0269978 [Dictyostelium discoideum AX4]
MGINDNGIYGSLKGNSTTGGIYKMGDHNTGYGEKNNQNNNNKSGGKTIVNGVIVNSNQQKLKGDENEFDHSQDDNADEFNKFPKKVKYNDLLYSVLFAIQMVLFITMTVIAGTKHPNKKEFVEYSLQGLLIIAISIPLILAFFLIWKKIFKIHPTNMIKTSFFSLMITGILFIGLLIGNGWYSWAIVFGITLISLIFFYFAFRDKIPFVGIIISLVLKIIEKYPSTLLVSFVCLIISCVYYNIWLFSVSYNFYYDSYWTAWSYMKFMFLVFNLYWTHYVITYTCYSVVSGLVASWYFFADEDFNGMPPKPCAHSLYRSMTSSFGSIAFGSLLVCLVQMVQFICRGFARVPGLTSLFCNCLQFIALIFTRMLYTFNIYTFSMVSIYGQSFCNSSKKTYNLMVNNNEKLFATHNYMLITMLSVSLSMFLIIGFIVTMIMATIQLENQGWLYVQLVMFLFILYKPFDIIFSSVLTILMCLISDPNAMEVTKPNTFILLSETYDFKSLNP